MELVIDNTETRDVTERALTWPAKARAIVVVDGLSYSKASDLLIGIKGLRNEVAVAFDPIIADAHRAHKTACDKKREAEAPLVEAERILKSSLSDYAQAQERLRREEQARLERQAREEDEQRRLNEAAAIEREATATGDAALLQEAERVLETPAPAPVYVPPTTPKVAGVVHRDNWSARVTSLTALIQFVAARPEHQNLLIVNQSALNQLAKALKSNLKIDGVQAVNVPTVASAARR